MGFEDDMIEAGYSDEQEYLDSILDDFEENYASLRESEMEYSDDFESFSDEEEESIRIEELHKREIEMQLVEEWKEKNPELAIIWQAYFCTHSYNANYWNESRHIVNLNEYNELKKWLNDRKLFESERRNKEWSNYLIELFTLYKNELFEFYFPDSVERLNMSIISQQASELSSIEFYEPSLWEYVCLRYVIDPKLFESIEEIAFWNEVYNQEMDYDYWKDTNLKQYNQFAKEWIADGKYHVYGKWLDKHKMDKIEWKNANQDLWCQSKQNYEIREKNKLIEFKIEEYKNKCSRSQLKSVFLKLDSDFDEYLEGEIRHKPFLPDLENTPVKPLDVNSLDEELRQLIEYSLYSFDMNKISIESSKYADEVLTQLWIYTNRDEWEIDEVKKQHDYLFRKSNKNTQEFLDWWKKKYSSLWSEFVKTSVPRYKSEFEVVMKFRLWALDGNKEKFFSLGEKYLLYWKETIKLMYGQDIHDQLCNYFYNESRYHYTLGFEDVNYIKQHTSTNEEVKIWQKELQDNVIWEVIYNDNYVEHIYIKDMYTSLKNKY